MHCVQTELMQFAQNVYIDTSMFHLYTIFCLPGGYQLPPFWQQGGGGHADPADGPVSHP